jgi:hypothetical protein
METDEEDGNPGLWAIVPRRDRSGRLDFWFVNRGEPGDFQFVLDVLERNLRAKKNRVVNGPYSTYATIGVNAIEIDLIDDNFYGIYFCLSSTRFASAEEERVAADFAFDLQRVLNRHS